MDNTNYDEKWYSDENDSSDEDDDDDESSVKHGGKGSDDEEDDDESVNGISQAQELQLESNNADGESDDEEDDDEDDLLYLQKFNAEVNKNYLANAHPECVANNYDEIVVLTKVIRDGQNNIIDPLHRTLPYLTKYERTRVLGQRAKQINSGSTVFVKVPENMIDGHLIAEIELVQKRIPFILRRPIPGGGCEYWNLKDLEIVGF